MKETTIERNKVDANIYIDRAIAMLKDIYKEEWLVAGYNGVVSLLGYAKESHAASLNRQGWTRVDVENIISMVCDQFGAGFAGRKEFIEKTIEEYEKKKILDATTK